MTEPHEGMRGTPEGQVVHAFVLAARQAGAVARGLQGRVSNEGKLDATQMPNDDDALRRRRAAKTVVDEVVQEVLLLAAADVLRGRPVALDAEEASESRALFAARGSATQSLVVDPVDGTVEYIAGKSSYSICLGLVDSGRMVAAVVHFPARDMVYLLDEAGDPFCSPHVAHDGLGQATRLTLATTGARRVYINNRVPLPTQQRLISAGFEVIDDTTNGIGAPDCILSCATGEAAAYVCHTRQMRDILLGAVVGASDGGYATDWHGHDLVWPDVGRVPCAVFGREDLRSEVLASLVDQATIL